MKSPFPGMDPYLEQFWLDIHAGLIIYSRDQIEAQLPANLIARVEERVVLETEEEPTVLYPDVKIYDTEAGLATWKQIAGYWAGDDDYATRAANLTSGNGVPLLDASVVAANGGGNTFLGYGGLVLLYTDGMDNLIGPFDPRSQLVNIIP